MRRKRHPNQKPVKLPRGRKRQRVDEAIAAQRREQRESDYDIHDVLDDLPNEEFNGDDLDALDDLLGEL